MRVFFCSSLSWLLAIGMLFGQNFSNEYLALQKQLASGWNTWSYESMTSHVLLPENLQVKLNFRQAFIANPGDPELVLDQLVVDTSGLVTPIAHTYDGAYTELLINNWKGHSFRVQSCTHQEQLYLLVTPTQKSHIRYELEVESALLWNAPGQVRHQGDHLLAELPGRSLAIRSTQDPITTYHPYTSPYLTIPGDTTVAIYTGPVQTLADIQAVMAAAEADFYRYSEEKYGPLAEAYRGIQSVLGWNTLYDPAKKRVLSPVSRAWNEAWQGYVLFNWDTYLASFLFALDNKDLAYSNAIAVTSYPHENGNIGHYQMADGTVGMMSQPPIGGTLSWLIYEKYQEAWFLEEVFDNLLQWNEWWLDYRLNQDYLAWGGWPGADAQIAAWESGLDNAPMYQGQQMLETENAAIHQLADVGLNSLYVSDCQHLAKMADVLGRKTEAQKLRARAKRFAKKVESLWVEEEQAYLNRNLLTQQPDPHLAPPLFYPLIAKIPSPARAQAFLKAHYHNEEEFSGEFMLPSCAYNDPLYDNIYWQGAIWPPLNFLVYLGLREYDPKVAGELAQHSYDLFLEAWQKHNYVFENINSAKGVADPEDQLMTDPFYHWGALMGVMQFMEAGWYDTNQDRLKP